MNKSSTAGLKWLKSEFCLMQLEIRSVFLTMTSNTFLKHFPISQENVNLTSVSRAVLSNFCIVKNDQNISLKPPQKCRWLRIQMTDSIVKK